MKTHIVFKKSLAYKLIAEGNILLDKEIDKKNNKRYVYIFKENEKFISDLIKLAQER